MWYLPHLPLFYPGLEIPCTDLLNSIHESIECDFWLDDIGVSFVRGKIEPPRCKNATIRLESERIYFTVEAANGPVSAILYADILTTRSSGTKLPNFDSVSPAAMGEISRILGWGPWGSSPRDGRRTRAARLPNPGDEKRHG